MQYTEVALSAGNVISDGTTYHLSLLASLMNYLEPGYYEDGNFGIRIESECPVTAVHKHT